MSCVASCEHFAKSGPVVNMANDEKKKKRTMPAPRAGAWLWRVVGLTQSLGAAAPPPLTSPKVNKEFGVSGQISI